MVSATPLHVADARAVATLLAIIMVPCVYLETGGSCWLSPPSYLAVPQWGGPDYEHGWPWTYAMHNDDRWEWKSATDNRPDRAGRSGWITVPGT